MTVHTLHLTRFRRIAASRSNVHNFEHPSSCKLDIDRNMPKERTIFLIYNEHFLSPIPLIYVDIY